jgi:hypothetical protein
MRRNGRSLEFKHNLEILEVPLVPDTWTPDPIIGGESVPLELFAVKSSYAHDTNEKRRRGISSKENRDFMIP